MKKEVKATQGSTPQNTSPLLMLFIGVVCIGICLSLIAPYLFGNRKYERIVSAVAPVVGGEGVLAAATYNSGTDGPHPIVILWGDGSNHPWNWKLPRKWFPSSPRKIELVALLNHEQPVALETCYYLSTTVTRYRNDLSVIVREARTGHILANSTLRGYEPMNCPESIPMDQTRIDGPQVELEAVVEWLCPFVQASDCP